MGSQTFEILRQGVWASLTGGWFYDPHQDIFCNTFHLYIWLFLLCLPFTVYLFFPPTLLAWGCYCIAISVLFGILKLVNMGLHHMYDTSECIREEPEELDGGDDVCRLTQHLPLRSRREEDGIELQVLGGSKRTSDTPPVGCASRSSFSEQQQQQQSQQIADTDSLGFNSSSDIHEARHSLEDMVGFNTGGASTIDLKVDVHRKNSSESSEEVALRPVVERVSIHRAEPCTQADHERLCSKMHEKRSRQRAGSMSVVVVDDQCSGGEIRRGKSLRRKASASAAAVDCHEERRHRRHHRPSLVSIESGTVAVPTPLQACVRRLSNTSNGSLGFLPGSSAGPPPPTIKPTGSLELGHMLEREKGLVYWKQQNSRQVRCIRSGVMELYSTVPEGGLSGTSSPSPASHHYPSYGSEIVYPIAEQSDEHQTSHGPDTDPEDRAEDENGGSRSPLLIRHESFEGQKGGSAVPDAVVDTQPSSRHASVRSCGINSAGAGVSFSTTSLDQACEAVFRKHFGASSSRDELLDENVRGRSDGSEPSGDEDSGASSGSRPIQELMDFGFMIGENVACVPPCGQQDCVSCGLVSSPSVVMSPKEAPSLVGLDWLFEHTDSETAQTPPPAERDANLWNCTRSDDSDCGSVPDVRNTGRKHSEDSGSSSTTLSLDHEVVKLLPGSANTSESGSRNQGAIPKQRPKRCNSRKGSSEEIRGLTAVNSLVKIDEKPRQRRPPRDKDRTSDEMEAKSSRASKSSNQPLGSCRKDGENQRAESSRHSRHPVSSSRRDSEDPEILPPAPVVAAFLAARRDLGENLCGWGMTGPVVTPVRARHQRLKRSSRIHRSRLGVAREPQQGSLVPSSSSPPSAVRQNVGNQSSTYTQTLASAISGSVGTHIATSHNDTTEGAVHYFQDEHGNWMSYTFHERGSGTANAGVMPIALSGGGESPGNSSSGSARTACGNTKGSVPVPLLPLLQYPLHHHDVYVLEAVMPSSQRSPFHVLTTDGGHRQTCRLACRTSESGPPLPLSSATDTEGALSHAGGGGFCFADTLEAVNDSTIRRPRKYYDLHLFKCISLKVRFDRLALIALLDRNLTSSEAVLSCILAIAVAVLGAALLHLGFYRDILAFFFCFVIASCQYSLLKSVQPDAASPTHGFNRVVALSRPVYFVLLSGLVLCTHSALTSGSASTTIRRLYGIEFSTYSLSQSCRDTLVIILLLLPIAFSLGLLPQVTTFAMYVLEQLDMHVFGGNAAAGLGAATLSVCRSIIAVALLTGFAYGALSEKQQSQHVLFSIFCGLLVSTAYVLSRQASDPSAVWAIVKSALWPADLMPPSGTVKPPPQPKEPKDRKKPKDAESATKSDISQAESDTTDPLPFKVQQTVQARLRSDGLVCLVAGLLICGIHASTAFTALQSEQSELSTALLAAACALGLVLHYIMPQLRKQLPWLCISRPVLRAHEHGQFEVRQPARLMWFEKVFVIFGFLERNILYPVLIVGAVTNGAPILAKSLGPGWGALVVTVCGLKCLRCSFSDCSFQYLVLAFAELLFQFDFVKASHTFIVDYFFMGILFSKMYEFLLKVQFVVTYIAPWQITWGSAFHAFAQPFSVPHSAMLFTQAAISALFSAPLNPFLGSAVFLASYARPVKFWERDYKTRRADHSNTRLAAHLLEHRSLGADDNNLNSIFYEHLTRSLQHSLCGDLVLGRWGPVSQGDCFVLASDYLNCLVHIVELGNGLVTFQVRGLEFRGTYCQQREVEAISEGVEDNDGCCCCEPGHLPHMLSINAAFSQRWLAWEVTATKYVLEGYSISDNSAVSMLQVFDFRKVLITYYVKSIIFYAVRSPRLTEWLTSSTILDALRPTLDPLFVDLDPVFNMNIDEDFDLRAAGITRSSFCKVYLNWIHFCATKRKEMEDACKIDLEQTAKDILLNHLSDKAQESTLVSLCFALSLLGRRTLGAASHNTVSSVEFFLYGLHALFKGDFRITSARDEWIFSDMELLRKVVAPGVRMSLKLHQDHFMSPDEYVDPAALYEAISSHEEKLVISHEGDPVWRNAVLSGTPSLLALRHVLDDGTDEYKVIMLNKRYLSFRVIKVNRECVRGLWAGQQQELVYLRNRNPERGSIQNAKQALRNIINSSCDQPIGYPIYVSPLTTSYAETNEQLCSIVGGPLSLGAIKRAVLRLWRRVRRRCGEGCSSGASMPQDEGGFGHEGVYAMTPCNIHTGSQTMDNNQQVSVVRGGSLGRGNRGSLVSAGKPSSSTLASLAGLLAAAEASSGKGSDQRSSVTETVENTEDKEPVLQRVRIQDPNQVYDAINLGRRIDVVWPDERMRARGGRSHWRDWLPERGMEGQVVHRWVPSHRDPNRRSHVDRTILLVKIDDKYVPIAESGTQDLGAEV